MFMLDHIFKTCCALHNMKLIHEHGTDVWSDATNRADAGTTPTAVGHRQFTDGEIDDDCPAVFQLIDQEVVGQEVVGLQFGLPPNVRRLSDVVPTISSNQQKADRKRKLLIHFQQAMLKKEVYWPRRNKVWHAYNPLGEVYRHFHNNIR